MEWYPPDVKEDCFIFTASADGLPKNPLLMPTVGNGHMATVVYRDRLFLNGLYNGKGKKSHRAAIPSLNRIKLNLQQSMVEQSSFMLDCIRGAFTNLVKLKSVSITHRIYAHRTIAGVIVNEVIVERRDESTAPITVDLEIGSKFISPDIVLEDMATSSCKSRAYRGHILEFEGVKDQQAGQVYIIVDVPPASLTMNQGEKTLKHTYLMSVDTSEDMCQRMFSDAVSLRDGGQLYGSHICAWTSLWRRGRIDCWGDSSLSRIVYGSLYYLYSSLRMFDTYDLDLPFFGLSPESLAYGDMSEDDYLGHVFWDQETWMYPPILLLHPTIAAKLLDGRCRVIEQAKANAATNGCKGAQFPWEQCVTGIPTSPSDDCECYEIHINADISLAIRHYLYATGSLEGNLKELASQLAEYWKSRVSYSDKLNLYTISGVMPPDEFHYPVDNSAYTNVAAQLAIDLPGDITNFTSHQSGSETTAQEVASEELVIVSDPKISSDVKIYVPFDDKLQYHPEFDGYRHDVGKQSHVKQADVVLIGYPLDKEPNLTIRKNDLDLYEAVTTSNGPAMTWSMFCVGHLELGSVDLAAKMFNRQLLQSTQPFQVWSEYPGGGGAINFITGMGGFLQSLLNGYAGVRLRPESLVLQPRLPPSTDRMRITGLCYWGSTIDVDVTSENCLLQLTSAGTKDFTVVYGSQKHMLTVEPLTIDLCGSSSTVVHIKPMTR